jgi:hypothetical protein
MGHDLTLSVTWNRRDCDLITFTKFCEIFGLDPGQVPTSGAGLAYALPDLRALIG